MRTHRDIIEAAGGYQLFAAKLALPAERVRFWHRRNSIPAEAWLAISSRRLCSLKELALAVAA
jgi:hypothetical protein